MLIFGSFGLTIATPVLAAFVTVVVAATVVGCVYIWVNGIRVPQKSA